MKIEPRVLTPKLIRELAKDPRVQNAIHYPKGQNRYPLSQRHYKINKPEPPQEGKGD